MRTHSLAPLPSPPPHVAPAGTMPCRIRFNMQGPRGHAVVWAEKTGAMGNGEFFYLIFQADGHKPVHVVDHRPVVPLHQKQEGAVELLNKTGALSCARQPSACPALR